MPGPYRQSEELDAVLAAFVLSVDEDDDEVDDESLDLLASDEVLVDDALELLPDEPRLSVL